MLRRWPSLAAVAGLLWNCMRHREKHAPSLLSICLRISRIAVYCLAVFILALAMSWSSGTISGAASSHLVSTPPAIEAAAISIAEAAHSVGEFHSCARDNDTPKGHAGNCDGCCLFSSCGDVIVLVAAFAGHPQLPAQFPTIAFVASRNARPPLTTCDCRRLAGHRFRSFSS
jgi:hypothetical protein